MKTLQRISERGKSWLRAPIFSLLLGGFILNPAILQAYWQQDGGSLNVDVNGSAQNPSLAVANGQAFVVWNESNGQNMMVYAKYWDGATWQQAGGVLNLNPTADAHGPMVCLANGSAYVAWQEWDGAAYQIYVKQWNGSNWQPLGGALNINAGQSAWSPKITCLQGVPYVAWHESNGPMNQIYVKHWTGSQWQQDGGSLNYDPGVSCANPCILATASQVYVAFTSSNTPTVQSYVKHWTGSTWQLDGDSLNVNPSKNSNDPSMAAANGTIYVAWREGSGLFWGGDPFQFYVKHWDGSAWQLDGGALNLASGDDATGMIAASPGAPYAAFNELHNMVGKIYEKHLLDGNWIQDGGEISSGTSVFPHALAVDQNVPYVAVVEGSPIQIYIRHWVADNLTLTATATVTQTTLASKTATTTATRSATATPTPSSTLTPTLTATPTPTSSATPDPNDIWIDHFNGIPGDHATGWFDANYQSGYNASITYASTLSWAHVQRSSNDVWGKVLSPLQTLNTATYPLVQINVTALSNCTWKLGIQEQEGAYRYWDLNTSSSQTGVFTFNYAALTGLTSGTHTFSVQVVVEGASGTYLETDWVKITRTGVPLTATPTSTLTATPTATQTPIPSPTPTPRPGLDGLWQWVGGSLNQNQLSTGVPDVYLAGTTLYAAWSESPDGLNNRLYAGHWNGSQWVSEGGQVNPPNDNLVYYPSVAAAADGNVYVAYVGSKDTPGNGLRVLRAQGGTWVKLSGDLHGTPGSTVFGRSDLIMFQGKPYVAWSEQVGFTYQVYVSHWDGGAWVNDGGDLMGGTGFYADNPTLGISASGQLYVCIHTNLAGTFGVSASVKIWQNGQWVAVGAPVSFPSYLTPRMVLEGDTPYVITVGATATNSVDVFRWNGSQWGLLGGDANPEQVYIQEADLAVVAGRPYVGLAEADGLAKVRHWDGTQWVSDGVVNSDLTHSAYVARLAIAGGNLFATWTESVPGGIGHLFCKRLPLSLPMASPTPTQTPSATLTPTSTASSTRVITQTATPSVSASSTPTATATPSATRSVTATVTSTSTCTVTGTATLTRTRTVTPTGTRTVTPTGTRTVTPTGTRTVTPTGTRTVTPTGTRTVTPTRTCTVTPTRTRTSTPTRTSTVTRTATPLAVAGGGAKGASENNYSGMTIAFSPSPTLVSTATPTGASLIASGILSAIPTFTLVPDWVRGGTAIVYPNPAHGRVCFAYRLVGENKVAIDIYRLTGERVAHLEERQNGGAGQTFSSVWEAAGVAPGVYFARIVVTDAGGREVVNVKKKVALLK
jgi:hypothetical protein